MSAGYIPSLERKKAYVDNLASLEGIDLSMLKWESELDLILQNTSFNVLFNYLLNLHLNLSLHFDMPELDFEMPNFIDFFTPLFEKIEKARYGISKYGKSIYDPEQVTSQSLQRLLWDLRYKTTDVDGATTKLTKKAVEQWITQLKKYLTQREVQDFYQDAMFEILALIEGKMSSVGYWDCAVWEVSVWSEEYEFKTRFTDDWKSEHKLETLGVYEVQWDYARWDYARWGDEYEMGTIEVSEGLGDDLQQRIDEFHKRSGWVEQYEEKTIYQRIFFYQKKNKMHWKGGEHQLRLQHIINTIKQLLNNKGIIAQFRAAYLAFAQELYYLMYEPHRKFKQWKKILTSDELVDKYVMMGLDKSLLLEIKGVIGR